MAIPTKDTALISYGSNFSATLAADPAVYLQTPAVATSVTAGYQLYADAFSAMADARENGVRSAQLTATKDDLRKSFVELIRPIYAFVQDSLAISDSAKIALGVHVRDSHPSPRPAPAFEPRLTVTKVNGNVVSIHLSDSQDPTRKGRAPGAIGASIFSHISETPPSDPSVCVFQANTGATKFDVVFPSTLTPGTKVWLLAFWFSERKISSPACTPVSATLNYPSSLPAAA